MGHQRRLHLDHPHSRRTLDRLSRRKSSAGRSLTPRWICLKLEGPFLFSQTGVLLSFIEPLSENAIPIFAISTFDTDYVLIPEEFAEASLIVLRDVGHVLVAGQ
jgi:hypothetical protein